MRPCGGKGCRHEWGEQQGGAARRSRAVGLLSRSVAGVREGGGLPEESQTVSHCKCEPEAGAQDLLVKFISVFSVANNLPDNFNTLHTK